MIDDNWNLNTDKTCERILYIKAFQEKQVPFWLTDNESLISKMADFFSAAACPSGASTFQIYYYCNKLFGMIH